MLDPPMMVLLGFILVVFSHPARTLEQGPPHGPWLQGHQSPLWECLLNDDGHCEKLARLSEMFWTIQIKVQFPNPLSQIPHIAKTQCLILFSMGIAG